MKEAGPGPYFPQIEAYKTLFSTQSTHIWTAISQQRGGTLDVDDPSLIVKFSNRQNSCYKSVGFCSSKKKEKWKNSCHFIDHVEAGETFGELQDTGRAGGHSEPLISLLERMDIMLSPILLMQGVSDAKTIFLQALNNYHALWQRPGIFF